ncbi:pentatricopeptide repeat-containing protein At1g11290, chloroplastic-like [Aristolochia californica]|uniref:pentatricopeptide repeat-containing protein At1g11290, chloroplastic-like n=1 Tax=Aristolochia californica TaxID=171875 RepID=UPI0035E36C54
MALGVFSWAEKQKDYSQFEGVQALVSEIRDGDFVMTVHICNSMLRSLGILGMVEKLLLVMNYIVVDENRISASVHCHISSSGIQSEKFEQNFWVTCIQACGGVVSARTLFVEILQPGVSSGNYIVDDYEMCGDVAVGNTYSPVQDVADSCSTGTATNVICVLAACAILGALETDKWVHFYITRNRLELTVNLGTTLMNLYAKCGLLDNSLEVFEQMPQKNVLSLTALILGLDRLMSEGQQYFNEMLIMYDSRPKFAHFWCMVNRCAHLGALEQGRKTHQSTVDNVLELCLSLRNSMIDMYPTCGSIEEAAGFAAHGLCRDSLELFGKMQTHGVGLDENAGQFDEHGLAPMTSRYAQNRPPEEAIGFFKKMMSAGVKLDGVAVISVLSACAQLKELDIGLWIHDLVHRDNISMSSKLVVTLVDMYAK